MKSIAVFNQKGGVGKTASVVNVAGCLEKNHKKKVLVIDCDSQCNATSYLLTNYEEEPTYNISDFLNGNISASELPVRSLIESKGKILESNIFVIPGDKRIDGIEMKDLTILKDLLDQYSEEYDYCIFDCPANLSNLTLCALSAVDCVIVPAKPELDSLGGFGLLLDTVNEIRNATNVGLEILGVFFNMVRPNRSLGNYIMQNNKEAMGAQIFDAAIRDHEIVAQARMFGRPVCYYSPTSPASMEYEDLTTEILQRAKEGV